MPDIKIAQKNPMSSNLNPENTGGAAVGIHNRSLSVMVLIKELVLSR